MQTVLTATAAEDVGPTCTTFTPSKAAYLGFNALQQLHQPVCILQRVIHARQHCVLHKHLPPSRIACRIVLPQHCSQLAQVMSPVDWHNPVPHFINCGME